jgi:hypothetical protein
MIRILIILMVEMKYHKLIGSCLLTVERRSCPSQAVHEAGIEDKIGIFIPRGRRTERDWQHNIRGGQVGHLTQVWLEQTNVTAVVHCQMHVKVTIDKIAANV